MAFLTWRQLVKRWLNGKNRAGRPARKSRRLDVEALEARLTPATKTWTGLGTDNLWTDGANWSLGTAPQPGDSLIFGPNALRTANTNNFAAGTSFNAITFTAGNYSLSGNSLALGLGGSGTITDSSGSGTNTINFNGLVFQGAQGTEVINTSGGTTLTVSSPITGNAQIKKTNIGTVVFSGDNRNFTGAVTVNQGAVEVLNSPTALGANNTTTVLGGATLQLSNLVGTLGETIVASGPGINNGGAIENLVGQNTLSGNITMGANVSFGADGSSTLTFTGPVTDNLIGYTLSKVGTGTVVLAHADTYSGATNVFNGLLNIQDPGALGTTANGVSVFFDPTTGIGGTLQLQLNNQSVVGKKITLNGPGFSGAGALENVAGNNTWDGDVLLNSNASIGADGTSTLTIGDPNSTRGIIREAAPPTNLTKEGTGTVLLNRANTYTGTTFVHQGVLELNNALAVGGSQAQGVVVSGRAALELNNVSVLNENLTLVGPGVSNTGALRAIAGADLWSGPVSLPDDASVSADAGAQLTISGVVSGPGGLTKYLTGEVVLTNANTYLGTTVVNAGILTAENNTALGVAPPASTLQSGVVVMDGGALHLVGVTPGGTGLTITNPLTLGGTGVNNTGAIDSINGTNLLTGQVVLTDNTTLGVESGAGTQAVSQLTMTGDFTELNGSFGLTKTGPNRLILTGANTQYSGSDLVAQGILTIESDTALGLSSGGGVTVNTGGALELAGGVHIAGPKPLTLSGTGINQTGALLSASGDNRFDGNVTFAGNVMIGAATNSRLTMIGNFTDSTQGFALTKAGAGKLVLGGSNTYTGGTDVQAGILNLQSNGALGTSVAGTTVEDGALIELQTGVTVAGQKIIVHGSGAVTFQDINPQWFQYGPAGVTNVIGQNDFIDPVSGKQANPALASGRITAIAPDPSNPNVIYIGAATGGVWKTKDGGAHWAPLTDNLPGMFVGSLAIDPENPLTIYAGTGEGNGQSINFQDNNGGVNTGGLLAPTIFAGRGIYKSTDGGLTWTLLGQTHFNRQVINKIVVDPTNPGVVYAATSYWALNGKGVPNDAGPTDPTGTGIWRSSDGGQTWTNTTIGPIWNAVFGGPSLDAYTDFVIDPQDHNNLYAAIGTDIFPNIFPSAPTSSWGLNGIYNSTDGGTTWALLTTFHHDTPPIAYTHIVGRISLAIVNNPPPPGQQPGPPVVFAVAEDPAKVGLIMDLEFSPDGGVTWTSIKPPAKNDVFDGQGDYAQAIAVDPKTFNVFLGGTADPTVPEGGIIEAIASQNFKWFDISVGVDGNGPQSGHHALVFDPTGRILDGTDGGLWRLIDPTVPTTPGVGPKWADLNANLAITQFSSIATSPTNVNFLIGSTQDLGTAKFTAGQAAWSEALGGLQLPTAMDGGTVLVDPTNSQTIYATASSEFLASLGLPATSLFRSTDGGQSWSVIVNGIPNVKGVGTITENTMFPQLPLVMDPANSQRLLTATDRVYESTNGGNLWVPLSTPNTNGWLAPATATINLLGIPNGNPNVIYADVDGDIYVTLNHGATWNKRDIIIGGVTINDQFSSITVDPNNPLIAYVTRARFNGAAPNTSGGPPTFAGHVFRTTDGGQNWFDITGNLPDVPTWTLAIDPRPNPNVLYVGTDQGVYFSTDLGQTWNRFGVGLPQTQVRTLILDQLHDYLTAGTYGRGVFRAWLNSDEPPYPVPNSGAIRAITGNNTWSGPIEMGSNITVGADIASTLTLSGVIDDGQAGLGLTKAGQGTVVIQTPNTFSGPVEVKAGILDVQTTGGLGTGSQVTVDNGATLQLDGDQLTFNQHLTLNGTGVNLLGAINSINGSNFWDANVTLGSDAAMGAGPRSQLTIGDPTSGAGVVDDGGTNSSLSKEGVGRVILTQGDTFGGNTNIVAGQLQIQNVKGLGKGGGKTIVTAGGTLELLFPPATGSNPPANTIANEALFLNGQGTLDPLEGFFVGALHSLSGNNVWAGTVTLLTNATIAVDDDSSTQTTVGSPLTITGGVLDNGTNSSLTKEGPGKLILTNANSYQGGTIVNNGVLNIQNNTALGGTNIGTTVNNGASLEVQQPTGGPALSIDQPLFLNGSGVNDEGALDNVGGNNTWNSKIHGITLQTTSGIGVENDPVTGQPLTFTINGGVLQSGGSVTGGITGLETSVLTKVGPGTLLFSGPNSYLGQTLVTTGILEVTDSQALGALGGDGTFVTAGATLQLANNLLVQGKTLEITGAGVNGKGALENLSGNNTWQGTIILNGNAVIGVDSGTTLAANRSITESVGFSSLTKVGGGTLILSGGTGFDNNYTGTTTVADGLVQLNKSGGAVAIPAGLIVGDGTGALQSAKVQWLANNQLAPSTSLTVNSDGLADLNGNQETATGLTMTGGSIMLEAGSKLTLGGNVTASSDSAGNPAIISGAGTLSLGGATRTFTVNAGGGSPDLVITSVINGTGSEGLTKAGTGALQLTVAEGYTGPTTVTGGKLLVDGHVNGTVALQGGTLGGSGNVDGFTLDPVAGGGVAPGDTSAAGQTPGILNVASNVAFNSQTTYSAELNGTTAGTGYSQLKVTGAVDLGGATLSLPVGNGFVPVTGTNSFSIIRSTGQITGQFAQGSGGFINGINYSITYNVFDAGTNTFNVIVVRVPASTTTAVSSSANPSVFGQPVTFTATITGQAGSTAAPGGTVTFTIDGVAKTPVNLSNGVATFTTSTLSVAGSPHTVSATYNPDTTGNFTGSSGSLAGGQVVNKITTSTTVTSSLNPAAVGQSVTFTATVNGAPSTLNPDGTVTFSIDGVAGSPVNVTVVSPGVVQATFTTSTLTVNGSPHIVSATYNPGSSGNFLTSSGTLTGGETIGAAGTTTSVTTSKATTVYGEPVTFTATVTPTSSGTGAPDGTVTFFIDGTAQTPVNLTGNTATFTTNTLTVSGSPHTISATYNPGSSGNFTTSSGTLSGGQTITTATSKTVVTSSANPSVFGQLVTFTATVSGQAPSTAAGTGTVTFTIDGTAQAPISLVNGVATFTTSALTVSGSPHSVSAAYTPADNNFTAGSGTLSGGQTVTQASTTTTVTSSANPSVFGQSVTFTATVSAGASSATLPGTVTFTIDGTAQAPVNLVNGVATFTTSSLTVSGSPHSVSANYNPGTNSNFGGSNGTLAGGQIVGKQVSSTTVSSSANPSVFGQSVTFTATVSIGTPSGTTPAGTVTFFIDGTAQTPTVTLLNGTATFTTSTLSVSATGHTVSATFTPTDPSTVAGGSGSLTGGQFVNPVATTTTVSGPSSSPFGQQVTFTATVAISGLGSGTPGGQVNFYDGVVGLGTFLGSGTLNQSSPDQTTFTTTALQLSGGNHTIIAVYQGSTNFATSQNTTSITITKANSTTSNVTSNLPNPVFGQSITFSTTVSSTIGVPTGTVNFLDNGVQIGQGTVDSATGVATFTTSTLGAGSSHSITATYTGNSTFNQSSSGTGLPVTVAKAFTGTQVATSNANAPFGSAVITATVTDTTTGSTGTPTGTVTFSITSGGTTKTETDTLSGGVATLQQLLGVGSYTITAAYNGDGNFQTSNGNTVSQTVAKGNSQVTLAGPGAASVTGQQVTFTATVANAAGPGSTPSGGLVRFFDNGTQVGSDTAIQTVGGQQQATLTIALTTATTHNITAQYLGDSNFNASPVSNTVSQVVNADAVSVTLTPSSPTPVIGDSVQVTATLSGATPGGGTPGGTVTFFVNGVSQGPVALAGGQATLTIPSIAAGNTTVSVNYNGGDPNYLAGGSNSTTLTAVTRNQAFIAQLFRDLLHREAGPSELTNWTNFVNMGISRTQIVTILESSFEYRADVVTAAFVHYLHHAPSPDQIGVYVGFLNAGGTDEQMASFLVGSPEYFVNRGGGNNPGFVNALFQDTLNGRLPTQGELNAWVGALNTGVSRQQVGAAILGTSEYLDDLVAGFFTSYLHRPASQTEINNWVSLMQNPTVSIFAVGSHGLTDEQVIAIMLGSAEYYNRL
jgi:autotransporter-associated beta strand protein